MPPTNSSAIGSDGGHANPSDGNTITKDDVEKRPISLGLLTLIVFGALSVGGGAFTIGTKWGTGGAITDAEVKALQLRATANAEGITALSVRIAAIEAKQLTDRYTSAQAAADWARQQNANDHFSDVDVQIRETNARIGATLESLDARTKRIETKIDAIPVK